LGRFTFLPKIFFTLLTICLIIGLTAFKSKGVDNAAVVAINVIDPVLTT
tara:strand:+ start:466 stop:612 length:147 start_codon:yes stop_codon:yes gene_type:complete